MTKTVVERAGDYIGQSARKASQFQASVANAVEDGLDAAKQAAQDGREVVEISLATQQSASSAAP